ncbi:MAG: helix-turn-helix domain-containing protein [Planctomycetota bacterium]|jgi:AraC-like DNA-binding protein
MTQSAVSNSLKTAFNREDFVQTCRAFRERLDLPLVVCELDGAESRSLCERPYLPGFCRRIRQSKVGAARCRQERKKLLAAAIRSRRPKVNICHAGIVSVCVPVFDKAGMFFGKCLSTRLNRKLEADVQKRLKGLRIYPHEILEGLSELPVVQGRKLQDAADFLHTLIRETVELRKSSTPIESARTTNIFAAQPDSRITAAIEFMRYNYAEPLTLAAIAYAAGLSPSRLGHVFVEQTGTTVFNYLNTIRIDHAKRLLKTTDANCTQIAYTTGYNSPAYFTRVFKKHTDQTPNQYRSKNK